MPSIYQSPSIASPFHMNLWKYGGKSAKRVTSRISWSGNNMPYFGGLGICKYNGKYLLELTGNACGDNYYYGTKKDGSVGLVHKFIWKDKFVDAVIIEIQQFGIA